VSPSAPDEFHADLTSQTFEQKKRNLLVPPISDQATSDFSKLMSLRERGTKSIWAAAKSACVSSICIVSKFQRSQPYKWNETLALKGTSLFALIAAWWMARATKSFKSVGEYPSVWVESSVKLTGDSEFSVISLATASLSWTRRDNIWRYELTNLSKTEGRNSHLFEHPCSALWHEQPPWKYGHYLSTSEEMSSNLTWQAKECLED